METQTDGVPLPRPEYRILLSELSFQVGIEPTHYGFALFVSVDIDSRSRLNGGYRELLRHEAAFVGAAGNSQNTVGVAAHLVIDAWVEFGKILASVLSESQLALLASACNGYFGQVDITLAVDSSNPEFVTWASNLPWECMIVDGGNLGISMSVSAAFSRRNADRDTDALKLDEVAGGVLVALMRPDSADNTLDYDLDSDFEVFNRLSMQLLEHGANCMPWWNQINASEREIRMWARPSNGFGTLHLSGHGAAGGIILESESHRPTVYSSSDFAEITTAIRHAIKIVYISSCESARSPVDRAVAFNQEQTSLAAAMSDAGMAAVVAMQTTVSDSFSSGFAGNVYLRFFKFRTTLQEAVAASRRYLIGAWFDNFAEGWITHRPGEWYAPVLYLNCSVQSYEIGTEMNNSNPVSRMVMAAIHTLHTELQHALIAQYVDRPGLSRMLKAMIGDRSNPWIALIGPAGHGKTVLVANVLRRSPELALGGVAVVVGRMAVEKLRKSLGDLFELRATHEELRHDAFDSKLIDQIRIASSMSDVVPQRRVLVWDEFDAMLVHTTATTDEDLTRFEVGDQRVAGLLSKLGRTAVESSCLTIVTCSRKSFRFGTDGTRPYSYVGVGAFSDKQFERLFTRYVPEVVNLRPEKFWMEVSSSPSALRKFTERLGGPDIQSPSSDAIETAMADVRSDLWSECVGELEVALLTGYEREALLRLSIMRQWIRSDDAAILLFMGDAIPRQQALPILDSLISLGLLLTSVRGQDSLHTYFKVCPWVAERMIEEISDEEYQRLHRVAAEVWQSVWWAVS